MTRKRTALIASVLPLLLTGTMAPDKGWRPVEDREAQQEWRATDPHRYVRAQGDFDGDGILDDARLMVAGDGKTFSLVVSVSSQPGQIVLDEDSGPGFLDVMGVSVANPGTYRTACGKGYFECKPEEPLEITLSVPGIDYFREESANSYFWWDNKTHSFKRTCISD